MEKEVKEGIGSKRKELEVKGRNWKLKEGIGSKRKE